MSRSGSRGGLDRGRVRGQRPVGLVEVGEQPGVLERDGGVRGEGGQQLHLGRGEPAHGPVDGEQRADHAAVDDQRHPRIAGCSPATASSM